MKNFKTSILAQALAVSLLGFGLTACSSPEQETEVIEEPAESETFETENELEPGTMGEDISSVDSDTDTDIVEGDIADEHAIDDETAQAHEAEGLDTDTDLNMADTNELDNDVEVDEVETLDNDDVLDGTEQEEHVSTY